MTPDNILKHRYLHVVISAKDLFLPMIVDRHECGSNGQPHLEPNRPYQKNDIGARGKIRPRKGRLWFAPKGSTGLKTKDQTFNI